MKKIVSRISKYSALFMASLYMVLGLGSVAAPMAAVAADARSFDAACEGATAIDPNASCTGNASGDRVSNLVRIAIRIFQTVVGVISIFVMIVAGLGYITSGGDSSKTKTAKDRLLYAAIGLAVVGLAEIIIRFVLNRVDQAGTTPTPGSLPAAP